MATALQDLFYGNTTPADRPIPRGSKMHKLGEVLCRCEETLERLLDEEGKKQLKTLSNAQLELESMIAEENFIIGFRLGVQIMVECLRGEPNG